MPGKVVMISGHAPFDGRIFHKEAKSLLQLGYEVTVVGWDFKGEGLQKKIDGIELDFRAFELDPEWSIYKKYSYFSKTVKPVLVKVALKYKPDVVHCHDHQTLPVGVDVKQRAGCKLVYDSHEDCPKLEYYQNRVAGVLTYLLESRGLGRTDAVVTVSDHIAKKFRKRKIPTVVIFNTTRYDAAEEMVDRDRTEIKAELGLPADRRIIGYIGSMNYRMDFESYVRALGKLPDNVLLVLVGGPEKLYGRLEEVARELGIGNRVKLKPRVDYDTCLKYIYCFDLGLLAIMSDPMAEHTLPTKIFEYMAMKVPCMSPDLRDMADFTRKWNTGFVFEDRTPKGIARAVKKALSNEKLLRKLGEDAHENVRKRFSWEMMEKRLGKFYGEVLSDV